MNKELMQTTSLVIPPAIVCRDLTKTYIDGEAVSITVLQKLNLEIKTAKMLAIVGQSGAGKSTLLHLLGGLDQPTSGTILFNGRDYQDFSEREKCRFRNRYLGFVYQFHHLLPEFSVLENVCMPLLIQGQLPSNIIEKAKYLLEKVALVDRMHHYISQLSGGERQRVAIARALINDPRCVLADEPTGNLDARNAAQVLELFFSLQHSAQTSLVIVTHDRNIAKQADEAMILAHGQLHPL